MKAHPDLVFRGSVSIPLRKFPRQKKARIKGRDEESFHSTKEVSKAAKIARPKRAYKRFHSTKEVSKDSLEKTKGADGVSFHSTKEVSKANHHGTLLRDKLPFPFH